ncbi:hypothetical protein FACS1894214_4880 [Planctomycetales bacterium]|nr:hypothetical protein FACS1894214_4880 [Planctomycetales bacterium]
MPKISVIIPVYKVEQYLRQCLDSVIAQTFKDIEIICVDDGSPDNCPQILEEYAANDFRIRVIHKENGGLSSARNAALPYVTGKYILFVDSDDWIEPDLLEKTVAKSEETNADMTLFFYEHPYMASQKIFNNIERIIAEHSCFDIEEISFCDCSQIVHSPTAWSKLWKADFIKNHKLIFPEGLWHEDIPFQWEALLHNPILAVVPERFYHYRYNPVSVSENKSFSIGQYILGIEKVIYSKTLAAGLYSGKWKELFLYQKLVRLQGAMKRIEARYNEQMLQDIHESIGDDEWEYLSQSKNLPIRVKDFYRELDGSIAAKLRNMLIWNPAIRIRDTLRLAIAKIRK